MEQPILRNGKTKNFFKLDKQTLQECTTGVTGCSTATGIISNSAQASQHFNLIGVTRADTTATKSNSDFKIGLTQKKRT